MTHYFLRSQNNNKRTFSKSGTVSINTVVILVPDIVTQGEVVGRNGIVYAYATRRHTEYIRYLHFLISKLKGCY